MAKLEKDILEQLKQIFGSLDVAVMLLVKGRADSPRRADMLEFMEDFASCSDAITVKTEDTPTEEDAPLTEIWRDGNPTGISFCGIPGGHEFTSLILAVLNAAGQGKNLPDEALQRRIQAIAGPIDIFTFVSLSCTNCPDVAQALNIVALLNPTVSNRVIDGGVVPEMVKEYGIQSVPTVYANGELLSVGRSTPGELVAALEQKFGKSDTSSTATSTPMGFDVLVAGGGPAGAASAIYLARKGLKVAVVAQRIGGQVKDTSDIENLISVPLTTGDALAADLRKHMDAYGISIFDNRTITDVDVAGFPKMLVADSGERFTAPQLIVATGAAWRKLNVEGEADYMGHGVAFCTHCDGPFYAGKRVAVVGGGNSGIEAAIDLAAICTHVDVVEFLDTLKADEVLQKKLATLDNVDVHLSSAVQKVEGNGKSVEDVVVLDRATGKESKLDVQGVFVQIGLSANSKPFAGKLKLNERGEIVTDPKGLTSVKGVYAAGDVTDCPYKQIVISMGSGATAALTAFDERMRSEIPT